MYLQKESVSIGVTVCHFVYWWKVIVSHIHYRTLIEPPYYRCLKLYCQCFALSTTCGPKCKCQTCHNTTLHAEAIEEARNTILERNPSAFDDKFRGSAAATTVISPYRAPPLHHSVVYHQHHQASSLPPHALSPTTTSAPWPMTTTATTTYATPSSYSVAQSSQPTPPAAPTVVTSTPPSRRQPPPRVNKFGCKCRRSFCLKKVSFFHRVRVFLERFCHTPYLTHRSLSVVFSIANATKIRFVAA